MATSDQFANLDMHNRTILVYSGVFTFLVDAYPTFAASALAANSFARSSFGAIFPLFGIQSEHHFFLFKSMSLLAKIVSLITVCSVQ